MKYENFTTFDVTVKDAIATVTFDFGTVNVQGQEMLADLNSLTMRLERDRETKVVIFQSANPEIWVCHYDTELLKYMSTEAVSREEAQLLDLQSVCERISKVPQATIAKLEGFARGGGHELALALDRPCCTDQLQPRTRPRQLDPCDIYDLQHEIVARIFEHLHIRGIPLLILATQARSRVPTL